MLFFYFNLSVQMYIKHLNRDVYVGGLLNNINSMPLVPVNKSERENFKLYPDLNGLLLLKPKYSDKVWDVGKADTLTCWTRHGEPNQRFAFLYVGYDTYIIKNREKCMEFKPFLRKYIFSECDDSSDQKFTLVATEGEITSANDLITDLKSAEQEQIAKFSVLQEKAIKYTKQKAVNFLKNLIVGN